MTLHGQRHHDCHLGLDHLDLKEVEVEKEKMLLVSDHDCRLDLKWADYVDLPAK